ncbi:hypothetical protein [Flagellimonas beolgyonensis]|uniref:AbiU2 domain-containing protein n=1 Tax=Flagellimonas beolgyonensis TaxID=864064 RepID=UPI000F8E8379|nr:hypothetical protein [Allomuricauda beolgyonensis]
MGKKAEIKKEIWEIWKIAINAKRPLKYSIYLHKPETPAEADYIRYSQDFQFIRHSLWRLAVIELSKLFNSKQSLDKFNIFHFIKKLENDGYYRSLKIKESKIDEWKKMLSDNDDVIKIVLKLRNKVYAHSDGPEVISDLDTPTFEQTEKLIDIIENVIQEIYFSIFNSFANVESPDIDLNPSSIIKTLAQEKQRRINEL